MVLFFIQVFIIQCIFSVYISVQTSHFSACSLVTDDALLDTQV